MSPIATDTATALPARLWSANDVASFFGITTDTLIAWEKAGKVPAARRIGKVKRWDPRVFAAMVGGDEA